MTTTVKKRTYDPKKYKARKAAHQKVYKAYYERNKDVITAKIRMKYLTDPDHKETVLERNRQWRANNKKMATSDN